MPFTLTMPKLSPTMEEGTLVAWHKKEGDFVEAGDLLFEVATDKATVEHSALDGGWLRKILVGEGGEAVVNQPVAIFTEEEAESIEGYQVEPPKAKAKPGKADEAAPAPEKQEVKPAVQSAGAMAQPVFAPPPPLEGYHFSGVTEFQGRAKASPLAKRLADEKGLDVRSVKGSGPGGRVLARDLDSAQPAAVVGFGPRAVPDLAPGTYEEESLTPMRKAISRRLQEAKTFIPHFYVRQSIEVSPLIRLREELKDLGHKVSFNDLITRACALALRQHPIVNSGFNTANNTITRYKTVDIAIAVAMEAGLITPILRHADYKTVAELSSETRELAKRARAGKLEPHEYQGGSFTISNLGMYGIDDFIAVINPPQGAILSVGGILDQPVVKDGQVVAGKVMNLILSSDHRVIDGAAAAEFLQTVRKYLEKPVALVM